MDTLIELQEKYVKVRKLIEDECKKDPESEPYRSKYKAKSILSEMKSTLTDEMDALDKSDSKYTQYEAMLAVVLLHLGVISLDTEELSTGEELLMKCLDSITDHCNSDFILVSLNARNQLGILWSRRSEPKEARTWLEGSEKLYEEYIQKTPPEIPKNLHEHFERNEEALETPGEKEIEKVHTLTKFYLAQVYGALEELLKSAIYCHETLRRQLEQKEYDPIDWALNSATLSQFFMERNLFKQARHHLAAASFILDEYEDSLRNLEGNEEEIESKKEEFRHRSSDVSRCWAKYGIFILEYSKNRLGESEAQTPEEIDSDLKNLWFNTLELSMYENQMADTEVLMFDDAREVFLATQKHLNKAKEYYSLEDHASDHVQVVQDHSQLYKHLSSFEEDEERQCKMIKKRIDLLTTVLKELNPQYYLSVCRQLWFELGESYHDLMHIKYQKMKDSSDVPSAHALNKINNLAGHSIMNFNHFLESVRDKASHKLPQTLSDDLIRPVLIAHFYLGRLYYKLITHDQRRQIENTSKSYECFKYLTDYCEKCEKASDLVKEELSVTKEMKSLLQMKIMQY